MLAAKPKPPITVRQYYRLAEDGILRSGERVELLAGVVAEMAPIGSTHGGEVNQLAQWLISALRNKAIIAIQNPVRLNPLSEPQPDVAVLRPRRDFYKRSHPRPTDVLLLIEVSDTTLARDRKKAALYAAAGIPEYWIVDLEGKVVEVYRKPGPSGYAEVKRCTCKARLAPQAFPTHAVAVSKLLR